MLRSFGKIAALGLISALLLGSLAFSQVLFGLSQFPGGTLHVVYKIVRTEADGTKTVTLYTVEIFPNPDGTYTSRETFEIPGQRLEEGVTTGMRRAARAAIAGTRVQEGTVADIDITPLQTLEEKGIQVQPNQTYYLPDGARLVTGDVSEIAGIKVVTGIYLHPGYPNQRVVLAFAADPEIAKLLPMAPLMIREVGGQENIRTELVEFHYIPPK